ncbi:RNA-directed DNA polymerase from mobile element jockey [Eumeta japonica]|uniref:RNA-directed DNA polymerase from mobile element jockey n=1 Tax=Eumeta variegata TaxID=151549 RepID=A0A4C1YLE6_EUMVA|nr:RNA-directed DNA polymerase from mobile element jockey [Eumeta japonica]
MDTQHLPILITLGTTAHITPARPQTHRTDWSAYQHALEELHIGKFFSCPEKVDLAAHYLIEIVQTAYSAATTHLPAPTSRRWDHAVDTELRSSCFFVAVEDTTSDPRSIRAGVSQGSCLSHCRYAAFTDSMPTLVGQLQNWKQDVLLALYVDDGAHLASSHWADLAVTKFQRVLDLLPDWLDKWVQYLDVQIDRSMRMAAQVKHVIHQSRAALNMLRPVFRSHLPLQAKVVPYKGYKRFRLTYTAPTWCTLCSTPQRKKIQTQ